MAVREQTRGQLRDLADCAAHDGRNQGHAYNHVRSFAQDIVERWSQGSTADDRLALNVLYPIRNIMGQINNVLEAHGLSERFDAKDKRSRILLAWSIAYALHGTSFDLAGEREARLEWSPGKGGVPHLGVAISFPEFDRTRPYPIIISVPWLLDAKDLGDWGQVSPVS